MARGNHYPFWTHDTVAAAVLAGVGAASFQIKLDALASELKIPAITACVHAWPMLLIFAGVVMLLEATGVITARDQFGLGWAASPPCLRFCPIS